MVTRDANGATPCDVARLTVQVATLQIAAGAWRPFARDEEYQFKVEQANFCQDQYLAEEVEQSSKGRRRMSERSEGHVHGQADDHEPLEGGTHGGQEMGTQSQETGKLSPSREGGSMQGEAKHNSEDELKEEVDVQH